ncbi:hypothetical protein ACH4S8_27500 [Streptomyces sp. NPDC021080]|uniref:hypothetical protein n=1 Tax=Streptomyces sp. NPDC021080 TaxID=3365110 RepID=UPI00378B0BF0
MITTDRAAAADALGRAMLAELTGCADLFRPSGPVTDGPVHPRRPQGPHGAHTSHGPDGQNAPYGPDVLHGPDAPHGAHR